MAGEATITFIGSLGGDPELRFTSGGVAVCTVSVAVGARKKNQAGEWLDGDTTWYRCNIWREEAENVAESLGKGDRVIVTGRLENRPWEDKEGGKRYTLEVQVDGIGPELRWAQVAVKRVQRGGGDGYERQQNRGNQGGGQYGGRPPADDPWGSAPQGGGFSRGGGGGGAGFPDEPPFLHNTPAFIA
jgi:single-strand DNA-binding protein